MHLLIPFASTDAPGCADALARLQLPHLDSLLALLPAAGADTADEFSLSTAQDRALAQALGLPPAEDGHHPWAAREAAQRGLASGTRKEAETLSQAWAFITPCHWQVATDHITMHNPESLGLVDDESRALLGLMQPFFTGDGITLHYLDTTRWLAEGEPFRGMATASLDRVTGRTVDIWMPRGPQSRDLRRLQSEMQMLLYTAAPNEAREAQRMLPVNSFWISDTGAWPQGLPLKQPGLRELNELRAFALREDWDGWADAWRALDAGPVAEALQKARQGDDEVVLTLCGDRSAIRFSNAGSGVWRRWQGKIMNLFGTQRLMGLRNQL